MLLKITSINFDFSNDDSQGELEKSQQQETIGKVYYVENEDDLSDVVSDDTGWCVVSIEYEEVVITKEEAIERYVDKLIDNMSTKDMMRILGEQLEETYTFYDEDKLFNKILETYPDIIK